MSEVLLVPFTAGVLLVVDALISGAGGFGGVGAVGDCAIAPAEARVVAATTAMKIDFRVIHVSFRSSGRASRLSRTGPLSGRVAAAVISKRLKGS